MSTVSHLFYSRFITEKKYDYIPKLIVWEAGGHDVETIWNRKAQSAYCVLIFLFHRFKCNALLESIAGISIITTAHVIEIIDKR